MRKQIAAVGLATLLLTIYACSKQTPSSTGQQNTGSINLSSEVAGMVLIDGTETDKRVKAQGTVLIENIATGLTEVAVQLDDGTVVQVQETVLIKTGETATIHIAAPIATPQEPDLHIAEAAPETEKQTEVSAPVKAAEPPQRETNTAKSTPAAIPAPQTTTAPPPAVPAQTPAANAPKAQPSAVLPALSPMNLVVEPEAADISRAKELKKAGLEYYVNKNYERAITALSEVIRLTPNDAEAYLFRGGAYACTGSHDRALTDAIASFRIEGDFDIIEQFVFGYLYGEFGTDNDYARALNILNAAIKIKPNLSDLYSSRGYVYYSMKNYDHAITDYTAALRIEPDDCGLLDWRGDAYVGKGDYDRAIADYEAALRINPDWGRTMEKLEAALQKRGY